MIDFYSPSVDLAADLGAACGHGALAAAIGIPISIVCSIGWHAPHPAWVNIPSMEEAMEKLGVRFRRAALTYPNDGIFMVQFLGPWSKPGVPARVSCMHRHWAASRKGYIWDINLAKWVTHAEWEEFLPQLKHEKSHGWEINRSYEVNS